MFEKVGDFKHPELHYHASVLLVLERVSGCGDQDFYFHGSCTRGLCFAGLSRDLYEQFFGLNLIFIDLSKRYSCS